MTRTLITGANGLVGSKLRALLLGRTEIVPTGRREMDVTDAAQVDRVIDEVRPTLVIHAAALTDVDGCERRREDAWLCNAQGTANVARAAGRVGARLCYLSTEYVFDGASGPYGETDAPAPRGVYALTKFVGEQAAALFCADHVIARTTVVYGFAPGSPPNFVTWLVGALRRGESVRIVADQIGSPTLADNLAAMLWAVSQSGHRGVVHTAGDAVVSRCDFALAVARTFGLDASLIRPVTTAELRQASPRPLRAGLRVDLIKTLCGPEARPFSLDQSLAELKRQMELA